MAACKSAAALLGCLTMAAAAAAEVQRANCSSFSFECPSQRRLRADAVVILCQGATCTTSDAATCCHYDVELLTKTVLEDNKTNGSSAHDAEQDTPQVRRSSSRRTGKQNGNHNQNGHTPERARNGSDGHTHTSVVLSLRSGANASTNATRLDLDEWISGDHVVFGAATVNETAASLRLGTSPNNSAHEGSQHAPERRADAPPPKVAEVQAAAPDANACLLWRGEEAGCGAARSRELCLRSRDGRPWRQWKGHLIYGQPCAWCDGENCTTNGDELCMPADWVSSRPGVTVANCSGNQSMPYSDESLDVHLKLTKGLDLAGFEDAGHDGLACGSTHQAASKRFNNLFYTFSAESLEQCRSLCSSKTYCKGVDFQANGSKCLLWWYHIDAMQVAPGRTCARTAGSPGRGVDLALEAAERAGVLTTTTTTTSTTLTSTSMANASTTSTTGSAVNASTKQSLGNTSTTSRVGNTSARLGSDNTSMSEERMDSATTTDGVDSIFTTDSAQTASAEGPVEHDSANVSGGIDINETVNETDVNEVVSAMDRVVEALSALAINETASPANHTTTASMETTSTDAPERHALMEANITEAPTTALSQPVQAGATVLNVVSQEGFHVGGQVAISGGGNSETRTIASFGSIVLTEPLVNSYPAGAAVTGVIEASTTEEASTAPATTHPPGLSDREKTIIGVSAGLGGAAVVGGVLGGVLGGLAAQSTMTTTTTALVGALEQDVGDAISTTLELLTTTAGVVSHQVLGGSADDDAGARTLNDAGEPGSQLAAGAGGAGRWAWVVVAAALLLCAAGAAYLASLSMPGRGSGKRSAEVDDDDDDNRFEGDLEAYSEGNDVKTDRLSNTQLTLPRVLQPILARVSTMPGGWGRAAVTPTSPRALYEPMQTRVHEPMPMQARGIAPGGYGVLVAGESSPRRTPSVARLARWSPAAPSGNQEQLLRRSVMPGLSATSSLPMLPVRSQSPSALSPPRFRAAPFSAHGLFGPQPSVAPPSSPFSPHSAATSRSRAASPAPRQVAGIRRSWPRPGQAAGSPANSPESPAWRVVGSAARWPARGMTTR